MGAYSIGSEMPTVLSASAQTVRRSLLHRKREDAIGRRSAIQPPASDNLKHLAASQSADRSACRLSIHPPSPSQVVERRPGGAVSLCVTIKREPNRQLGPAQVSHAGIDEGVEKLEAQPRSSLACRPPGGRRRAGAQLSTSPSS
jgi:hypothetical protein